MSDCRRPTVSGCALIAAALLLVAVPARAQDAHGAIAFGNSAEGKAVAYGFAWNHGTGDAAMAAALDACLGAGGTECGDLARFRNGCGALALDRHGMAEGTSAMSRERAEANAMRACEAGGGSGCGVVGSQCASSGGQAGTWSGSARVHAVAKGGAAAAGAPRDAALTRADRIGVQRGLAALRFDAGLADGMFGPRTRAAIRAWQQAKGLAPTGSPTRDEAQAIAAAASPGQPAPQGAPAQARAAERPRPKCKGMAEGSKCWREVSHRPGCHVWNLVIDPTEKIAWTGGCSGGTAHGRGALFWSGPEWHMEETGEMVGGRRHGPWTLHSYVDRNDSNPFEGASVFHKGPYADGKMHGRWVVRWASGDRFEGEFRDDHPNGYGTYTDSDGTKYGGQWRDGCFDDGRGKRKTLATTNKACGFE